MTRPTTLQVVERMSRVPPNYRFVDQTGKPIPPFGFHFPWRDADGTPMNRCAICEKGSAELAGATAPCDYEWEP